MPYPSETLWRERLETANQHHSRHLVLVAERAGQVVGNAGLHPAGDSPRRQHALSLGIMVASHAQGQGVGRALMAALIDVADQWANAQRIELTVFVDNARAIALYRSLGFEEEGRLRGYAFRHGRYEDVLAMARWRPAPPAAHRYGP
jgi:putative acetyltransferase